MNHLDIAKAFLDYLRTVKPNQTFGDWKCEGLTELAFGTPGGTYSGIDGFLFSRNDKIYSFIIRSIPRPEDRSYLVIESMNLKRQLYNIDLSKEKTIRKSGGQTTILESYIMTLGWGKLKTHAVKSAFNKLGFHSDEITVIDDRNPDWGRTLTDLLEWAVNRERVKTYLKETQSENDEKEMTNNSKQSTGQAFPLNQILYGPPGTGKTYNSIKRALEILGESDLDWGDRKALKKRFDQRIKEGRIVFTTFHQSMSYEDFIEGIKPKTDEGKVVYEVEKGIFRELCERASQKTELRNFEEVYDKFVEDVNEAGELDLKTPAQSKPFRIVINSSRNPVAIPRTHAETRMVVTKEMIQNYLADGTIRDWKPYTVAISNFIKDKYPIENTSGNNRENPYVLIIDEINRGNIAQIFGELITLIEEDKRMGNKEQLEVKLPYSSKVELFGVPSNLFIIGTMNTADRSVESLDTALRRRFSFEEMSPKPELLSPNAIFWAFLEQYEKVPWDEEAYIEKEEVLLGFLGASRMILDIRKERWDVYAKEGKQQEFPVDQFNGVNLETILKTINLRIEKLLDSDHQIGHSYFMRVFGMKDLQDVFFGKVIPLLQEYFFGDYGKIGLVLGKGFVRKKEWGDLKKSGFADFDDYEKDGDFNSREVYEVVDFRDSNIKYPLTVNKISYEMNFEKAVKLLLKESLD